MISRIKVIYLKAIIVTSLVWVMIDVFILLNYTDCNKSNQDQNHKDEAPGENGKHVEKAKYEAPGENGKPVEKAKDEAPGENGKPVEKAKDETPVKNGKLNPAEEAPGENGKPVEKAKDDVPGENGKPVEKAKDEAPGENGKPLEKAKDETPGENGKPVEKAKDETPGENGKPVEKAKDETPVKNGKLNPAEEAPGENGKPVEKAKDDVPGENGKPLEKAIDETPGENGKVNTIEEAPGENGKLVEKAKNESTGENDKPNPTEEAPGENGKPVMIPKEKEKQMLNMFEINQFNLMASEMISLDRNVPDFRFQKCKHKVYPDISKLPATSVIIVFHNEAWTTLLRTVHSVINRSPRQLLVDIVLVDDASERDFLGQPLEDHVSKLPVQVTVVRMKPRTGVIKGRTIGANHAKGKVLTFLDAHCECTEGWLEPLLSEVYKDRKSVSSPLIDIIDLNTFAYDRVDENYWGGFNWRLTFGWYIIPERENIRRGGDKALPVRSPTIAGGLFTMDRDFFYEIGTFDHGMNTWGGENLDISWRTWLCHGTLLIVPCSRVGHVFRKKFAYTFPFGGASHTLHVNNARLAEVWMDEYKHFFYKIVPEAAKVNYGNITERLQIKKNKKAKSFKWYLENIYSEMMMPLDYKFLGQIYNTVNGMCMENKNDGHPTDKTFMAICNQYGNNQVFLITKENWLVYNSLCLSLDHPGDSITLYPCTHLLKYIWKYNNQTQEIIHMETNMCLMPKKQDKDGISVTIDKCNGEDLQKWIMKPF